MNMSPAIKLSCMPKMIQFREIKLAKAFDPVLDFASSTPDICT